MGSFRSQRKPIPGLSSKYPGDYYLVLDNGDECSTLSNSFLEKFAIFSREQEHTQKESGTANTEGTSDLVSYVEFQKNHR